MQSLRSQDDAPIVESAFSYLFRNRMYMDFHFISGDGDHKFYVHKLVVAIHSPVLSKIVYSDRTSFQMECDCRLAVQNMINYFYGEDLVLENVWDIRQTKALADRYEIVELGRRCSESLTDIPFKISDVIIVLETALNCRNQQKEDECYRLIGSNQDIVFNSKEFLGITFKNVLKIFEKIKSLGMMTEVTFLRSAIEWLDKNDSFCSKSMLMEKVHVCDMSEDDYMNVLFSFPTFFTNIEICSNLKNIKSRQDSKQMPKAPHEETENNDITKKIEITHNEDKEALTNENEALAEKNESLTKEKKTLIGENESLKKEKEALVEKNESLTKEKETLIGENESLKKEKEALVEKNESTTKEKEALIGEIKFLKKKEVLMEEKMDLIKEKEVLTKDIDSLTKDKEKDDKSTPKQFTIQVLKQEDGVNVFNLERRVRVTVQDGTSVRSLQIAVDDVLKKGLIGTVYDKKGNYTVSNLDISYEGIYFMTRCLKELDETLSPLQYVEVLKAALHFQLKDLSEKCLKKIRGISDFDPLFLDGLRTLSYLNDKCPGVKGLTELNDKFSKLLVSEPLRVILHPNFINCSVDLILSLLQQTELKVKNESQLLLVIISWIESRPKERKLFRETLLKNLSFQNISTADFKYANMHYPNFFSENEQKLIIGYKNAVGSEVKFFRDNLPDWYNFKSRRLI